MSKLPKDCSARVIGAEARKLVHYKLASQRWEYREVTGNDNGVDCIIELIEQEQWTNKKIDGQIKGTKSPQKLKSKDCFSFSLDVKTINYALSCSNAFVLFYVDVDSEKVYYLPIQDYFIADLGLFNQLEQNKSTMNIHIPCCNLVCDEDYELQQVAKSIYNSNPSRDIKRFDEYNS